ncbi:MAG: 50S ribosomal protein L3 [Candidatus Omnitrophota bacterium]|nr:50S ribosomal protein L3 [Candidatus Omnitrophota bacterium]
MISGLLGKKIGMTQIFGEEGNKIPVTVIEAGPCFVQAFKVDEKDGYNAVQMGYEDTKEKRLKKPQREYLRANGLKPKKFVGEIRCEGAPEVKIGDQITCRIFQKGDLLDVMGVSKGKGFQGGMKRCGWSGGKATHGSMAHRAPGSMGASSYPSRIMKGHGGAGHMGNRQITVQNLEVIDVYSESNTVIVRGAVPGATGSYLVMRYAKKKPVAPREEVPEETKEAPEEGQERVEQKAPVKEERAAENENEKKEEEEKAVLKKEEEVKSKGNGGKKEGNKE